MIDGTRITGTDAGVLTNPNTFAVPVSESACTQANINVRRCVVAASVAGSAPRRSLSSQIPMEAEVGREPGRPLLRTQFSSGTNHPFSA